KNITEAEAYDHILGYTCFNDVSQRNFQKHDQAGWFRGKSLDTFGPIGPRVVTHEEIGDPQNLAIQTRLNGEVVQDANTSLMFFPIRETIAFISKQFTLVQGDLIVTGTPKGVGPLAPGDVVEVEIDKIGVLKNPVEHE
ncbi:MAG: fumarylacetoacetate hydrolase family protein, partial [Desulfofustis sp.]